MYIIEIEANPIGGRSPLQTWSRPVLPDGYAWCPDEFYSVFYGTSPAGFVHITIEGDTVVGMTVNTDAYNAYIAANPPAEPAEALDYDAVLLDHDFRLLCLEMGLTL